MIRFAFSMIFQNLLNIELLSGRNCLFFQKIILIIITFLLMKRRMRIKGLSKKMKELLMLRKKILTFA